MRAVCISMLLMVMIVAGCASSHAESQAAVGYNFTNLDRVAIVEVTGRAIYGEAAKNQIANMFVMELMKKGYTVIERSQVKALLKEQEFQASDLADPQGAAKAGKILNVPAVLMIDIPKYGNEKINMTAKLVDVQTATILWLGSGDGTTGKTAATVLGAVAGVAAGAALGGGDTNDRVIGGVIGGVAGGVAGNLLSPSQEKQFRKVVAKVAASLPARIPQAATAK